MKILCITLANPSPCTDALLPPELLATVADMIDAGYEVHWSDEPVHPGNQCRITEDARAIKPDVVFFCCQSRAWQPVMASIAASANSLVGNDYVGSGAMHPLGEWRELLSERGLATVAHEKQIESTGVY